MATVFPARLGSLISSRDPPKVISTFRGLAFSAIGIRRVEHYQAARSAKETHMARTFMTNAEIMEQAQSEAAGTLDRIRRDTSRTEAWKQQEIARTYRRMCQTRDRLIETRDDAQRQHQRELEGALFGASATSGDPASWAISRRDAGDRVAQIKTPTQAAELLARAERSNDEPLARAVAERAHEMDWADVANAFLDGRPHLEDRFTELWSQAKPSLQRQFHDAMVFQTKPEELHGMSDYQIDRLAAEQDGATSGTVA